MTQPLRPRAFTLIELPKAVSKGFTLIELLVVITIIVVLLALLAPALDKAVYQAQLAVCGTNLRGTTTGAQAYAVNFNRRYPYRPGQDANDKPANNLVRGADGGRFDNRPIFRGYIASKLLVEPLAMKLDFDTTQSDSAIWMSYTLWFGFTFKTAGEKGMMKMGDRFTWGGKQYSVLAADYDLIEEGALTHAAHPDLEGKNHLVGGQDVEYEVAPGVQTGMESLKGTASWWDTAPQRTHDRGPIDTNAAFDDGSVERRNNVRWNEWQVGEGVDQVPDYPSTASWSARYIQIPSR